MLKGLALGVMLVVAACDKPREQKMFGESSVDVAKLTVSKLALEAYPQWARANPDKQCPSKIEDLAEYMDTRTMMDPWGTKYRMLCGTDLPSGARGIGIQSAGEDGRFDTADDVNSWL